MSFKQFKNPFDHVPHLGGGFQRKSEGCHVVAFSFVEGGGGNVRPLITHQDLGVFACRGYAVGIVHLVDERGPGAVVGYRRHSGLGLGPGKAGDVSKVGDPLIAQHLLDKVSRAIPEPWERRDTGGPRRRWQCRNRR